jgi:hypothetical protein
MLPLYFYSGVSFRGAWMNVDREENPTEGRDGHTTRGRETRKQEESTLILFLCTIPWEIRESQIRPHLMRASGLQKLK